MPTLCFLVFWLCAAAPVLARLASPPLLRNSTFEQLIDHSDPDLGTFSQFYYYSTEFWGGPGSPIILYTEGESSAEYGIDAATTNMTVGLLASQINAAVIILEHRYWGQSSPFSNLSTANLRYLTIKNSMNDFVRFASLVNLPFNDPHPNGIDLHELSRPNRVPWIMAGGSYSGALTAWIASMYPGTFWAYYASSAAVQNIDDYWEYFHPLQRSFNNCCLGVSMVLDHIDNILSSGTIEDQAALKGRFGLQDVEHGDDFANAIMGGPMSCLMEQPGTCKFCNEIEGRTRNDIRNFTWHNDSGVSLDVALAGYSSWVNNDLIPTFCAEYGFPEWGQRSTECFNTYNASSPIYTNLAVRDDMLPNRQWQWLLCNEPLSSWRTRAPGNQSNWVSRLVTLDYWKRQCSLYFPPEDGVVVGVDRGATGDQLNAITGGWNNTNTTRLIYANNEDDWWGQLTVSSVYRPGGPFKGTEQVPVVMVPGGYHMEDMDSSESRRPQADQAIETILKQLRDWVAEFPKEI